MTVFFVPYTDNAPAPVSINGHRVLIVASDSEDIVQELSTIGADEIREIHVVKDDDEEISQALAELAADIGGGVVLTPPGITPRVMIDNLSRELPWIH